MNNPFTKGKEIINQIENHGYRAYFVGGCVRDWLMKRTIGDIDIATSAKPHHLQAIFEDVIPVGIEHGTVIVRWEEESFEITTFRLEEAYSDQRHPDLVTFVQTIDQDLKRRDFTMNAVAMSVSGKIIDPFEGQNDITNEQIRAVGNSYERFYEDPLRIIRAVRFSSQLGFSIEQDTLHAMKKVKNELSTLAIERVTDEMTAFVAGPFISNGIFYLLETGLLAELPVFKNHPEIEHVLPEPMLRLESFSEWLAMLRFQYPHVTVPEWVRAWKASNQTKNEATLFYETLTYFQKHGLDRWFAYMLPAKFIPGFMRLAVLLYPQIAPTTDAILEKQKQIPIQSKRELALNGEDILVLFPNRKKGPWVGQMLSDMEYAVVRGTVANNRQDLTDLVQSYSTKEN